MALDALTSQPIVVGAPVVQQVAITQHHNLVSTPVVVGGPVVESTTTNLDQSSRLPIPIDWQFEYEQTFEYKTDIITSRNGTEQRRATRATPRRTIAYSMSVAGEKFRDAANHMASRYDDIAFVPNPSQSGRTASALPEATNVVELTDIPAWLVPGTALLIGTELVRVLSVAGNEITIHGVAMQSIPEGYPVVAADPAMLDPTTGLSSLTNTVLTGSLKFFVLPEAVGLAAIAPAGDLFDGREVFAKKPNWKNGVSIDITSGRELVDYGVGRIAAFTPQDHVTRDFKATYLGRSVAETLETLDFFRRMRGRCGEFFWSPGTADIIPKIALTAAQFTLTATGRAGYLASFDGGINSALCVTLSDGSRLYRKIEEVVLSGGDSIFMLDAAWDVTIPVQDILHISFMPLCRFGSDTLTIQWRTDSVAEFNLTMHTLIYHTPE